MHEEELESILTNLISNAMKYTTNKCVNIVLMRDAHDIRFEIKNGVHESIQEHLPHLWEAFYVGEASRCKFLSGTDLGLYHISEILNKYGMIYGCKVEDDEIIFYIEYRDI